MEDEDVKLDQQEIPAKDDADDSEVVTLTKKQLTGLIKNRLGRQKTAISAQYADYDQLKAAAAERDQLKKAQETDVERQIREAREAAAAEVPTKVSAATQAARDAVISAEIRSLAAVSGFKYPEDVIAKLKGDSSITVGEDFKVSGVKELVEALAQERPEWLAPASRTFSGAPPRGNGSTPPPAAITPGSQEEQEYLNSRRNHRRRVVGVSSVL